MLLSAAISGGLYALSRSWELSAAAFISGVFLDVDHIPEYLREYGWRFDVGQFFRASYDREYKKVILVFHAWEWLPLAVLAAWASGWNPWVAGFVIGWLQHMLADQLGNTPNPWAYLITWRWRKGFDHQIAFPRRER